MVHQKNTPPASQQTIIRAFHQKPKISGRDVPCRERKQSLYKKTAYLAHPRKKKLEGTVGNGTWRSEEKAARVARGKEREFRGVHGGTTENASTPRASRCPDSETAGSTGDKRPSSPLCRLRRISWARTGPSAELKTQPGKRRSPL